MILVVGGDNSSGTPIFRVSILGFIGGDKGYNSIFLMTHEVW
jgi:hypothetical protein